MKIERASKFSSLNKQDPLGRSKNEPGGSMCTLFHSRVAGSSHTFDHTTTANRASYSNVSPASLPWWRRGWQMPLGILGFYILALFCAAFHLIIFNYLNGRVLSNGFMEILPFDSTSISQTYTTTISLALVTVFRTALVASIGICYTQLLWKKLRNELLEVGLIEELFQIRANALRLLNPALLFCSPMLLLIASVSWLLPVAMIYPPGALVVGLENRRVHEMMNASIIPEKDVLYPFELLTKDPRRLDPEFQTGLAIASKRSLSNVTNPTLGLSYIGPTNSLGYLASSVIINSRISDLQRPSREDVSYMMRFHGPMLQCRTFNSTRTISLNGSDYNRPDALPNLQTRPKPGRRRQTISSAFVLSNGIGIITANYSTLPKNILVSPCPKNASMNIYPNETVLGEDFTTNFEVTDDTKLLWPVLTKHCVPATAEYNLTFSFKNNTQHITYTIGDKQVIPEYNSSREEESDTIPLGPTRSVQEYFNLLALIDALGANFKFQNPYPENIRYDISANQTRKDVQLENGSYVEACPVESRVFTYKADYPVLLMSSFNTVRPIRSTNPKDIEITEALLNEALANITISSLSLNKWYGLVNSSSTRVFNVYKFENRLSFYLPYGLSLLFALPILLIGILALNHNGVTAIDGGFLQILMTTTGNNELGKVAAKGCMGGEENIPKELKKLKVRFGELLELDRKSTGTSLPTRDAPPEMDTIPSTSRNEYGNDGEGIISLHSRSTTPNSRNGLGGTGSVVDSQKATDTTTITQTDLNEKQGQLVRRAGFGTLEETAPLKKGIRYG